MNNNIDGIIILRHIKVENANAIAGMTWGFPAVSNFLGFTHALQRKFAAKSDNPPLTLLGAGIVCHQSQVQAYKPHDYGDYSFALTRNPVDKTGKSAAFVEEGRMHMDVSLVIPFVGYIDDGDDGVDEVCSDLLDCASIMRLAGGTITSIKRVDIKQLHESDETQQQILRSTMRSLLPGFALVSRLDTLAEHQNHRKEAPSFLAEYGCSEPDLAAWLEFSALSYSAQQHEDKITWPQDSRAYGGWLKPISVGYRAISALYQPGQVANVRDNQTPVRMVELLYSLGEWLSPHRIKNIEQLYWYAKYDQQNGLYQCVNDYKAASEPQAELTEQALNE